MSVHIRPADDPLGDHVLCDDLGELLEVLRVRQLLAGLAGIAAVGHNS